MVRKGSPVRVRTRALLRSIGSLTITALALLLAALAMAPGAAAKTRPVLLVGNNWDGTADVLDVPTYKRVRRINVVPDLEARQFENLTPARAPFAVFVRTQVGEGHDQMVDDLYASPDGRTLYVSRPSFNDVVAISLATGKIVWRQTLTGVRADHMAISPDGRRLVVSTASAAGPSVVDVLDSVTARSWGRSPPETPRTRTSTRATAAGSSTPASAGSTPPPTTRRSTRARASACSRSSTPARSPCSRRTTWPRSSPRPATPT